MVRDSQLERRSLISCRAVFLRKVLPIRLCQLNVASITCAEMKGEFNASGGPIKLANSDLPLQNLVGRSFFMLQSCDGILIEKLSVDDSNPQRAILKY